MDSLFERLNQVLNQRGYEAITDPQIEALADVVQEAIMKSVHAQYPVQNYPDYEPEMIKKDRDTRLE